jgi:Ca2+-binding RTX toxin-like protein
MSRFAEHSRDDGHCLRAEAPRLAEFFRHWEHRHGEHSRQDHGLRYGQDWNHGGACGPRQSGVTVEVRTVQNSIGITGQASADALGSATLASTDLNLIVIDRGFVSFAIGTAQSLAAAFDADPDAAQAFAYASTEAIGADISFTTISTVTGRDAAGASQHSVSTTIAASFAFDTDCVPDSSLQLSFAEACASGVGSLEGNLATFQTSVIAEGQNSFVSAQVDAISIEGAYSSSVNAGMAAVDADITYTQYTGTRSRDVITTVDTLALVRAGRGDDVVRGGAADDWLYGEDGDDTIQGNGGDDTIQGGDGDDQLSGGDGRDWIFGGDNEDRIAGNLGDDLLYGGEGRDRIEGGGGNDLIDGGKDDDILDGGAGDDTFRLGARQGDGDDRYTGGGGADLFLIVAEFDDDTIVDFSVAQGDRLVFSDLLSVSGSIRMARTRGDADDLVVTINAREGRSTLVLDEFFAHNAGFGAAPSRGDFSAAMTSQILGSIAIDRDDIPSPADPASYFLVADLLIAIG